MKKAQEEKYQKKLQKLLNTWEKFLENLIVRSFPQDDLLDIQDDLDILYRVRIAIAW